MWYTPTVLPLILVYMDTEHSNSEERCACHSRETLLTSRRVQSAVTLALFLLAAFLFTATITTFKEYRFVGSDVTPSNVLSVEGEGEVFAVPDTAEFTFSLTEEGATAGAVQEAVSVKAKDVISALTGRNVEEKDIKTVAYELQPKYEWEQERCVTGYPCGGKQVHKGFTLTQSVRVKVRALDTAGELIGLVSEKGVSNVSGLTFTVADEDELQADARKAAIDDARAKAEKLALDLGVTLVRMVNFSEGSGYVPMPYYAKDALMATAVMDESQAVVPAGENRITSNVSITYEIR